MSPVFNEEKYRALRETLEISEVGLSELEKSIRLDSEFYSKANLQLENTLTELNSKPLPEYCVSVSDGNHMSISAYFSKNGIPYYRGQDIYNFFIEQTPCPLRVPEEVYNVQYMKRSHLHQGDILMSIVGAIIGNIAIVSEKSPAICSCKLAIIRPQPSFKTTIAFFLKSSFGHNQIERLRRGGGQTGFLLEDFSQLQMPNFTVNFRQKSDFLATNIYKKYLQSTDCYKAAEQLLLQELGLADWQPDEAAIATKTFADFQNSSRLDAEYYQPKYQAISEKLAQYSNGTVSCKNILVNAMTKLTAGVEYCYLELADIGKSGEINSCTQDIAENLPSRARQKVKTNDVIVSSIEGSLASCALITKDYNNAICSTGFHVLRSTEINPETLLLLMKSSPIQALLKQGCSGTILTAILPDAFKSINLPLIRKEVQKELATKVQESFALRKESKRLLDLAKHAVEVAIEQGEDAAIKLLEDVNGIH